jgi:hypothetical protein
MNCEYGMKWERQVYDIVPVWTVEPDLEVIQSICRIYLEIPSYGLCSVTPLAEGGLSKIFKINTDQGTFVMRVALPINMPNKTQSEVATASFLRSRVGYVT